MRKMIRLRLIAWFVPLTVLAGTALAAERHYEGSEVNLVLAPTLDDVLLTQLGQAARAAGDDLTWLITSFLAEDSRRRGRWSRALADLAVTQCPDSRAAPAKWAGRWGARADEAALGLGTILEDTAGVPAADVAAHARAAREHFLDGLT